jgi:1,2-diacylglycerol 3-alpha-glucosyltransferase
MRILIVTETYAPNVNGSALATERLAKGLSSRGHIVSVVAPSTNFRHNTSKQGKLTIYRLRSILVQKTQEFRVSPQLLHAREFNDIVLEVKPDIIHINNPGFIAWTAISVAKDHYIPIIGTGHFMAENLTHYLRLPNQIEKILNTSVWKAYAKFYGRLNLIVSPTPTAANLLKKLKVNAKIEVISNGLDLKKFNPNNKGAYLKKRFNLPKKTIILYLGRVDKEKNIDVLIEALANLKNRNDFHALIVGKGKEELKLKKMAQRLDVSDLVTFAGHLPKDDLPNIYRAADIFVMPGTAELQSLVTMEAMASGLPVVGANAVALPHLIKTSRNGYLFKPGNVNDLSAKLKLLLDSSEKRRKMGKKSREIIKDHDAEKVLEKTEKIYTRVIKSYYLELAKKRSERKSVIRRLKKLNLRRFVPQELRV